MTDANTAERHSVPLLPPVPNALAEYITDAWQRSVLFTDVMRQRGNQYQRHMSKKAPNVLSMKAEVILHGHDLPHPVNYVLTRITPPKSKPHDPFKRPFVVVDPRAGHGPGIAGFKPESEIGVAIDAGHPCYFIGFLPEPEPEQTVEDVIAAEARFLEEVIALHPQAEGKPVVIGNCQAGWQLMMTAAIHPELFGPIIIAGAPLSYWAGWRGKYPMRYTGGMSGGSWMTMMASDLGNGKFDGAHLVQNFENMNPANTLWSKQYNLYANIDTEAGRYLGFERWWGGHVYLNGKEIQYIVDNLFVGNRLSTARMVTKDGMRIDLRNIQSPIIVFCSKGDNITPPPQALGWITDLYQTDEEIRAHNQTIIYAVHESIGHLGIFVSGSVANKEHREFTCNIDMIDVLPAGIYEARIEDKTAETLNADLAYGDYVLSFDRRNLNDIRRIVDRKPEDDLKFAAVSRISQINLGLYRTFVQPWLKMMVTPMSAKMMQDLHPLRMPYEVISDKNPVIKSMAPIAVEVRNHRQPAAGDNPFLQMEKQISKGIESTLELFGEARDKLIEQLFMTIYGSPLIQDLAGLGAKEGLPRRHPGVTPEHVRFVKQRIDDLRTELHCGGVREANVRVLIYISHAQGGIDERSFNLIRKMRESDEHSLSLQDFKHMVREQALIMMLFGDAGVDAIPELLANASEEVIKGSLAFMTQVALAGGPLNDDGLARLEKIKSLFNQAARRAKGNVTPEGFSSVSVSRLPRPGRKAAATAPESAAAISTVASKSATSKSTKAAAAQSSRARTTSVKAVRAKPSTARTSTTTKVRSKSLAKKKST